MHFVNNGIRYKLDTDATDRNAPITITNATTWTATIPAIESGFLPRSGEWNFDMEFYATSEGPRTFVKGTINIIEDVTK